MDFLQSTPRIFLTDYASYNDGTQLVHGHWVDLTEYSDADKLRQYITDHFAEIDESDPLPEGTPREEVMITDYEGLPEELYSKSDMDWDKVYEFLEIRDELAEIDDWLGLHNQWCENTHHDDDRIYYNDEEFFSTMFTDVRSAVRAAMFGDYNLRSKWVTLDGYANLQSINNLDSHIDKDEIVKDIIENPSNYSL